MITLTFAYPGPRLTLGPYDSLRFEGQAIRATAGGTSLRIIALLAGRLAAERFTAPSATAP